MPMPWQLREGLKRRPKGRPPRPVVEQLPKISAHELQIPPFYDEKTYILSNISFRFPQLAAAKVSAQSVEFQHQSLHRATIGPIQTFAVKHIRTGFNGIRHAFICACQRPVTTLYYCNRQFACRRCSGAIYASQTLGKRTRPILRHFLDNCPSSKILRHRAAQIKGGSGSFC
jgi:hypothetical protein